MIATVGAESATISLPTPHNQDALVRNLAAIAQASNKLGLAGRVIVQVGQGDSLLINETQIVLTHVKASD